MSDHEDELVNPSDRALEAYLVRQGPDVAMRRQVPTGQPPWPDPQNPMLRHLLVTAAEIAEEEGTRTALVWLGAHAFFEGGIQEAARASGDG